MQEKVFLFGSHLRLTQLTSGNNLYEEAPITNTAELNGLFARVPGIARWQAVAHQSGVLKTPSELKGVILKGVGRDYDWDLFKTCLVDGRLIDYETADSTYSTEVIISRKMARELLLKPGDKVLIYFVKNPPRVRNLTVAGIYETGLIEEFDDKMLIGDIGLVQRINDWDTHTVGSYELYVNDFTQLDQVYRQLFESTPADMFLMKITDLHRLMFDWLLLMDTNTTVLITLILIVACFNIISVLLIMIMERTPLIGLLKTLGSPNAQIREVFTHIGLYIIVKGLIWGNLTGLVLCGLQQRFKLIPLDPVNYFIDTVPIAIDAYTVLWINLATILIVGLIVLIPTSIISKIQPAKALVYKK